MSVQGNVIIDIGCEDVVFLPPNDVLLLHGNVSIGDPVKVYVIKKESVGYFQLS